MRKLVTGLACALVIAGCGTGPDDAGPEGAGPEADGDPSGAPGTSGSPAPAEQGEPESTAPRSIAVRAEVVVDGLDLPNDLADLGDGRLLIGDQRGVVHVLSDGEVLDEPFLDLSEQVRQPSNSRQELGLSGIEPHPDFASNGRLYVLYTAPPPDDGSALAQRVDVLAEFTAPDPAAGVADPGSERVLLSVERESFDHVGGHLVFGDDGMLYAGLGDGGDPESAQDPSTLAGGVIRIDVDGEPYAVPSDNPFASGGGAPEIYSYGLRNPFRLTWDDELGLIITDPKFTSKDQEVHVAVAGGNFGYPVVPPQLERGSCYESDTSTEPLPECVSGPDGQEFIPPVIEFPAQITSGAVRYRGDDVPELDGMVIVAEWTGTLLAAEPVEAAARWLTTPVELELPVGHDLGGSYVWMLDRDAAGEVYVLVIPRSFRNGDGVVYRLAPA